MVGVGNIGGGADVPGDAGMAARCGWIAGAFGAAATRTRSCAGGRTAPRVYTLFVSAL